jgi:hypothetical protein
VRGSVAVGPGNGHDGHKFGEGMEEFQVKKRGAGREGNRGRWTGQRGIRVGVLRNPRRGTENPTGRTAFIRPKGRLGGFEAVGSGSWGA